MSLPDANTHFNDIAKLTRRLDRERHTRLEAERIAEKGLRELYDKQEQLRLLERITVAANESSSLSNILQLAVSSVCQFTGSIFGHAYLADIADGGPAKLIATGIRHGADAGHLEAFSRLGPEIASGTELARRVLATGAPQWVADNGSNAELPKREGAGAVGTGSAFAFPVLVGSEVVAVVEFFSDQIAEPNAWLLQLASQIGTQMGRVVERKRAAEQQIVALSERQAKAAHARLREAIDMLPEAIVFMDRDNRLVLWNRKYAELYSEIADVLAPGVSYEHILRVSLARRPAEEIEDPEQWIAFRLAQHANPQGPHEQRFQDGRWVRYEERRTGDGGSIGVRIDITDLKKREQSFRLLFEANPVPMWPYDPGTLRFPAVNDAAIAHYGYGRERFLDMRVSDMHPVEERQVAEQILRDLDAAGDGGRVWSHLTASGDRIKVVNFVRVLPYADGLARLVAVIDVTERLAAEERLSHMARHDALTNLPNRVLFRETLEAAIVRAQRGGGLAVHCLDLDRFKDVNDTLGHPIGDLVLVEVARRLCEALREGDVVARLGGDEFAIIQCDVDRPEQASDFAARLVAKIGEPYNVDGHELVIGTSDGIALAPGDGADPDQLLKSADLALYRAKTDGRGTFRFFERQMDARLQARRAFESDLRAALVNGQFELHYQPLFNIKANAVVGFEALLRWDHPARGLVAPADFIPVAEETGLIVPIGDWVLRQACAEAANWPAGIKVAVNLSAVQFKSRHFFAGVVSALAWSQLPAERLELEVTETVLLEETGGTLARSTSSVRSASASSWTTLAQAIRASAIFAAFPSTRSRSTAPSFAT